MPDTKAKAVADQQPVRAFIIGDRERGLTIVITDPVMVVHYSATDLQSPDWNDLSGLAKTDPDLMMGAIVQHLVPHLRGAAMDKLEQAKSAVDNDPHGSHPLAEEKAIFSELGYANALGRVIRAGGTICDVDFCIALNINPALIVQRGRAGAPANDIGQYLALYGAANNPQGTVPSKPMIYKIGTLNTGNLENPKPWPDEPW